MYLLRYVLSENQFYQCVDEKWAPMIFEKISSANYESKMSSSKSNEKIESSSGKQVKLLSSSSEKNFDDLINSSSNISSSFEKQSSSSKFNDSILVDSRDGLSYRIVKIADQVWMAENLNYKVDSSWCFKNESDSCLVYGRLYQWTAAMNLGNTYLTTSAKGRISTKHQGVCPKGWHIPDSTEWEDLLKYVDLNNGDEPTGASLLLAKYGGSNKFGFNGNLAGIRSAYQDFSTDNYGKYYYVNSQARYWSSSETKSYPGYAYFWYMGAKSPVLSSSEQKSNGFSVRCKKD